MIQPLLQPAAPVQLYPCLSQALPPRDVSEGAYRVPFARSLAELDQVLRLRFEVLNLELGEGLDSATEYDLAMMPDEILRQSVEVGRACIAREHRGGLALYMAHNRLRHLFG